MERSAWPGRGAQLTPRDSFFTVHPITSRGRRYNTARLDDGAAGRQARALSPGGSGALSGTRVAGFDSCWTRHRARSRRFPCQRLRVHSAKQSAATASDVIRPSVTSHCHRTGDISAAEPPAVSPRCLLACTSVHNLPQPGPNSDRETPPRVRRRRAVYYLCGRRDCPLDNQINEKSTNSQ